MMRICLIHGHGASSDSFNFIKSELAHDDYIDLEYDSNDGFADNLKAMSEQLKGESSIFFVAHSLGGLYALHLADILRERCIGAVTMGTPYGGSEAALWLNLSFPQQLYRDIHSGATPITQGRKIELRQDINWTAIISTKGHSQMMSAANDGVVSIDSMRQRRGATFIEVASTHHEILMSRRSIEIIKASLEKFQGCAA